MLSGNRDSLGHQVTFPVFDKYLHGQSVRPISYCLAWFQVDPQISFLIVFHKSTGRTKLLLGPLYESIYHLSGFSVWLTIKKLGRIVTIFVNLGQKLLRLDLIKSW